jgi:hypothetical protein
MICILIILGSGLGWIADVFGLQVLAGVLTVFNLVGAVLALPLAPAQRMRA